MFTQGLRPRLRVGRVACDQRPVDIEQHRLELETHVTTRPLPRRLHVPMVCTDGAGSTVALSFFGLDLDTLPFDVEP
jgi:hypothetical protein